MRLRDWFKSKKAKAIAMLGCFAMLLGVGASVSVVSAVKENEVVETKAASKSTGVYLPGAHNSWAENDDSLMYYYGTDSGFYTYYIGFTTTAQNQEFKVHDTEHGSWCNNLGGSAQTLAEQSNNNIRLRNNKTGSYVLTYKYPSRSGRAYIENIVSASEWLTLTKKFVLDGELISTISDKSQKLNFGVSLSNVTDGTAPYGYSFDGWYWSYDSSQAVSKRLSNPLDNAAKVDGWSSSTGQTATIYGKYTRLTSNKDYFINAAYNDDWHGNEFYVHYWNSSKSKTTTWPGIKLKSAKVEYTWAFTLPEDCAGFVINQGSGKDNKFQTEDLAPQTNENMFVINTQKGSGVKQNGVWTSSVYYILFSGSSYERSGGIQMHTASANLAEATDVSISSSTGNSVKVAYYWYYWGGTELEEAYNEFKLGEKIPAISSSVDASPITFSTNGTYSFYVNNDGKVFVVSDAAKVNSGYLYVACDVVLSELRITTTATDSSALLSNVRGSSVEQSVSSASLTFDGRSYVHKFYMYNLRGTEVSKTINKIELIAGTKKATMTGTFNLTSSPMYYVNISGANITTFDTGRDAYAAEAALAVSRAINSSLNSSVCNINQGTAKTLQSKYDLATTKASSLHTAEGTTILTWDPSSVTIDTLTNESETSDVRLSVIMTVINSIADTGSPAKIIRFMPSSESSPLTVTLWIVLGSGMVGLGAIGTAYFVSKKKKKHQA